MRMKMIMSMKMFRVMMKMNKCKRFDKEHVERGMIMIMIMRMKTHRITMSKLRLSIRVQLLADRKGLMDQAMPSEHFSPMLRMKIMMDCGGLLMMQINILQKMKEAPMNSRTSTNI